MTLVSQGVLKEVWFGFDEKRLLLRVDTEGPAQERLAKVDQLRVGFVEPAQARILVDAPSRPQPVATLQGVKEKAVNGRKMEVATDQILELAVPFEQIGRVPGEPERFFVELFQGENSVDRRLARGCSSCPCPRRISRGSCGRSELCDEAVSSNLAAHSSARSRGGRELQPPGISSTRGFMIW